MTESEIIDLTTISRNFPQAPLGEVIRDNLSETIERTFDTGIDVIIAEGVAGIGKTTLLAQFAKKHPNEGISIFIRPGSRFSYDPDYIRLVLCEQIHWALYKNVLPEEQIDKSFLNTKIPILQKRALISKTPFYFIIDGIHHIPDEDYSAIEIILKEMLPIGLSGFRFLLSGETVKIKNYVHKTVSYKPFVMPVFSLNETEKYLQDLSLTRTNVESIHRMCRKIPGNLASVRRIIKSKSDVEAILQADPGSLPDFMSIEWGKYVDLEPKYRELLALIAFSKSFMSIKDLARISGFNETEIERFIKACDLLAIDSKTKLIEFISEPHRKFASNELRYEKERVTNIFIDDLLKDAGSESALRYLPTYYEQAGRSKDLLNYLTPENISRLLERSHSMSVIQHITDLGLNTAKTLNDEESLVRFSMHKAVINELNGVDIWASEIEARMNLKDEKSALAIAQNANSKEEKFHLLAIIAKIKCMQGHSADLTIMEQIGLLYEQIDFRALGDRAFEIASVLIWVDPDLAIRTVEIATGVSNDGRQTDWSFAKLSVEAQASKKEQVHFTEAVEKTIRRLSDTKLQEFSLALDVFFRDCSAKEVIELVEKTDLRYRLLLLRHWAMANESRTDAAEVIDYALDLLIKDAVNIPKTQYFLEIAKGLPSVIDVKKAKDIVGRFDSLKSSIEIFGTTQDYVGLQLILAETESKYDFESAYNRVFEIYWYIGGLNELSVRTDCFALMVTYLKKIDPEGKIELKEGLQKVLQEELDSSINQILDTTADHYLTSRSTIQALAKTRPEAALELVNKLNTSDRRDMAFGDIINVLMDYPINVNNISLMFMAFQDIVDKDYRDYVLDRTVRRLESYGEKLPSDVIVSILPLLKSVKTISSAYLRCKVSCFAYVLIANTQNDQTLALSSELLENMAASWESIDIVWNKIDAGFKISGKLAIHFPEIAQNWLTKTEKLRDVININAEESALTYMACLQLSIRTFAGLLPKHINTEEDLRRLEELIDGIPSCGERAGLFGELAFLCYINNDLQLCKRIVSNHVRPLLDRLTTDDSAYKFGVLVAVLPSLYYANRTTAMEMIANCPKYKRDSAYIQICNSILTKTPSSDPYEFAPNDGCFLCYEDAVEICKIMDLFSTDTNIYTYTVTIASSILNKINRLKYTAQQKNDIANRIQLIIDNKLPDQDNIKHNGYKIIAQAQLYRITRANAQVWEKLINDARKIPNKSDQALVLNIIAMILPAKMYEKRDQLIIEVMNIIESIPVILEKVELYQDVADRVAQFDMAKSKTLLKSALELSMKSSEANEVIYPKQRRIIDLAYKIDPSFADQLAIIVDNDPARIQARAELREYLDTLKLKAKMSDPKQSAYNNDSPKSLYPQAAWMNLGALNAGKINTLHFDDLIPYIQDAASLPISEAYPILAWVIANLVKRIANTDQARSQIIPMFNNIILGAELSKRLATRFTTQLDLIKKDANNLGGINKSVIIKANGREKALEVITQWLREDVQGYLKISDPYFGIEDLEILKLLNSVNPDCVVSILTSKKHQEKTMVNLDEAYRAHWRFKCSSINPPKTEIFIVGTQSSGDLPIHDRWWITKGAGLRIGTSFNSLGLNKLSEISFFTTEEAHQCELEVDQYLKREKQEHANEKLYYTMFTL